MLSCLIVLSTKAIVVIPIINWTHCIGQNGMTITVPVEPLFIHLDKRGMTLPIFQMAIFIR